MRRPDRAHLRIASDGRTIAYLSHGGAEALNLWVGDVSDPSKRRQVTSFTDDRIEDFLFCCGGRHLLYMTDGDGDEIWRLNVVNPQTGDELRFTLGEGVRATIVEHNARHPDHTVLSLSGSNPQLRGLHVGDLRSGRIWKIDSPSGFARWLVDRDLTVRGGVRSHADGSATIMHRPHATAPMEVILDLEPDDATCTDVIGFDSTGGWLYLSSSVGADHVRLLGYDVAARRLRVLSEEPGRDVAGVWLEPRSFTPDVVVYSGKRPIYRAMGNGIAAHVDTLLRQGDNVSVQRSDSDRYWIVSYDRPEHPIRYFSYDRHEKSLRYVGAHNDELESARMSPMRPFTFAARDGLELNGYVTLPSGAAGTAQPTVLLVHGGPWSRDEWQFNPVVQWISSVLGFACLQVNFRGSTGAGKAFRNLGNRQWGKAMNDDLLDGVAYAVEQGWADPNRVAVMGASYGGYAALMAVAAPQQPFRCAIAQAAPTDLVAMLETLPPHWHGARSNLHRRIGDPATDRAELHRMSPIAQADRIEVPVMLADGAQDPRIPVTATQRIVDSLSRRGIECHRLVFPDDGHIFARRENVASFYAAAGQFLRTHLAVG
ncbi:S9 family peptidase [Actinoplanes sp. NPDC048796]|uniref:alpha/beta hydrolase family protein n=1 Tax=Actinoplanes sp. NPDC048796 TaxID=3155640 RepID=UPI0033F54FDF